VPPAFATQETPVFVLAGGRGERLAGLTAQPKPLVPLAGQPFALYLLLALGRQGFCRFTFLTGFRAERFAAALAGLAAEVQRRLGVQLELDCLAEEQPLGTGGALRRILPRIDSRALVINGDSYCEADLRALLRLQRERGDALCLVAARIEDAADYGRLQLAAGGRIVGFQEKGRPGPAWINAGLYAVPRRFLATAIPPRPASLEREILPAWVAREATWALCTERYFCDIGTPARLAAAEREFPTARLLDSGA